MLRLPIAAGLTTHQAFTLMRKSGVRTDRRGPSRRTGSRRHRLARQGRVCCSAVKGPGLTDEAIALCDARVTIPMAGGVESLNVAAAGAILVYAARRQRA